MGGRGRAQGHVAAAHRNTLSAGGEHQRSQMSYATVSLIHQPPPSLSDTVLTKLTVTLSKLGVASSHVLLFIKPTLQKQKYTCSEISHICTLIPSCIASIF